MKNKPPKTPTVEEIWDAVFIEDCHVSGMHDPTHTPKYVCDIQLRHLALRVLKVFGIDFEAARADDVDEMEYVRVANMIPRRLYVGTGKDWAGWYTHFKEHNKEKAKIYEQWEKEGITPK